MSIIGTFNGIDVISLPANPTFREVKFTFHDAEVVSASPFTGAMASPVLGWPGADNWSCELSLPPMRRNPDHTLMEDWSADWIAWLMEMRGMRNVCAIGDPTRSKPRGNPQGNPVIAANVLPNQDVIQVGGWIPNSLNLLLPGDHIQLNQRLHVVMPVSGARGVSSDGSGNSTFNVWPSIREPLTPNTPIIMHNATGLFRLSSNDRSYSTDVDRTTAINFNMIEAR